MNSSTNSNNNKSWYIGISVTSIIIIIFLFIVFFVSYKNNSRFFSQYDPTSNKYIVNSGENGLQYINLPSGVDAYIDSNSTAASQKQSMIQRALSSLEADGTAGGYLDLNSTYESNNFSIYILLLLILFILLGCLVTYAVFNESK